MVLGDSLVSQAILAMLQTNEQPFLKKTIQLVGTEEITLDVILWLPHSHVCVYMHTPFHEHLHTGMHAHRHTHKAAQHIC